MFKGMFLLNRGYSHALPVPLAGFTQVSPSAGRPQTRSPATGAKGPLAASCTASTAETAAVRGENFILQLSSATAARAAASLLLTVSGSEIPGGYPSLPAPPIYKACYVGRLEEAPQSV